MPAQGLLAGIPNPMKKDNLSQLHKKLNESIAFHKALSEEIASVQHDAGQQAQQLSRLNGNMAMLESSNEPDEELAKRIDRLKQELDDAEAFYKSLQAREKKLQTAEIHAAQSVQTLQSELKMEELKKGRD
ncbi:hypothetical protein GZ77_17935 [Endozoicomonas montiporae]|uniref:Uncharacterized protein n=2 Tax=Endozoicomonas montiporae TaxID=1027273 RepID=A0A081N1U4_9GAMM|nr:hypothetical protein [Endozoicomonas montiporae]AMO58641.1 hypothetical protein EZMO1_4740 [Endozoicomonas montiporae CL-33]KEQ12417.1 hypothetical protein GZ77_17935 [Endozoicomonas montiporae]